MCGIVGYWSKKESDIGNILLNSLKNLEYRGYDSWGIVVLGDKLNIIKKVGKIGQVENINFKGKIGIAHTRWATHGVVSEKNSHPHSDCKENIFVAHNGIIENYQELKEDLVKKGHIFKSETDTEVVPHLIEIQIS